MPHLEHEKKPGGVDLYTSSNGQYMTWFPHAYVRRSKFVGFLGPEFVAPMVRAQHVIITDRHRLHIFVDWYRMTGYDPEARRKLTESAATVLPQVKSWNILVGNALVNMGVNVANAQLIGGMRIFTNRHEFHAAFEEAMRNAREMEIERSSSGRIEVK